MSNYEIKIDKYKNKVDFDILGVDEYSKMLFYRPEFINIYKKSSKFDMGTYRYFLKTFPKCIIFEKG